MQTYPISVMDLEEAKQAQFQLVDKIHREFRNDEFFQIGDVGLGGANQFPLWTEKVERVLADYFGAQSALLVRGAGTGAIRMVLNTITKSGEKILVHQAPIYHTTQDIIESMGLWPVYYDYHHIDEITEQHLEDISFAVIQHSRQKLDDRYELSKVIDKLKEVKPSLVILTDDNYVVFKAHKIGCQLGAEVSAFSLFKLFGPEGIGCLVGSKKVLDAIRAKMYSGGSKVQGHEAMEALRSMVFAPVSFAIQREEADKIVAELNSNVKGIKQAYIANAQSRVILVEFEKPIAKKVLAESRKLGAASYPVGSESRYEVPPLFYRVSGTFRAADPKMEEATIRINPMRAGKIEANSYVIDLESVKENAAILSEKAKRLGLQVYAMTKQVGRNPLVAEYIVKGGINQFVAAQSGATKIPAVPTDKVMRESIEAFLKMKEGLVSSTVQETDLAGHAEDAELYAKKLEIVDSYLQGFIPLMTEDDLLIITGDHGNDPTIGHSQHTRERTILLAYSPGLKGNINLGERGSLADIAATAAEVLGVSKPQDGLSFLWR